jgi:hypothetical protein
LLDVLALAWCSRWARERARTSLCIALGGDTPFRWEMNSPHEMDLASSAGTGPVTLSGGVLSFTSQSSDPYIFLRLEKQHIPSAEFPRLRFRIRPSKATKLAFYFWTEGEDRAARCTLVDLRPGWQERVLALDRLDYHFEPGGEKTRWGGMSGAVRALRIDPGMAPGVRFDLDFVRMERREGGGPGVSKGALLRFLENRSETSGEKSEEEGVRLRRVVVDSMDEKAAEEIDRKCRHGGARLILAMKELKPPGKRPSLLALLGPHALAVEFDALWLRPEAMISELREAALQCGGRPVFPGRMSAADVADDSGKGFFAFQRAPAQKPVRALLCVVFAFLLLGGAMHRLRRRALPGPLESAVGLLLFLVPALFLMVAFSRFAGLWEAGLLSTALGVYLLSGVLFAGPEPFRKAWGLNQKAMLRGTFWAGLWTVFALGGLFLLVWATGSLRPKPFQPMHFVHYLGKGAVQQLLLCGFLAAGTRALLPRGQLSSASLAGLCFGLLHLPNFALAAGALVAGTAWAAIFQRTRALGPLIVSHAVIGSALVTCVGDPLLLAQRVGGRFFF